MTLKLDRSDCNRLALACASLQQALEREAADPATGSDRQKIAQSSAEMWKRLHDAIREQVNDFDRKQGRKMLD